MNNRVLLFVGCGGGQGIRVFVGRGVLVFFDVRVSVCWFVGV